MPNNEYKELSQDDEVNILNVLIGTTIFIIFLIVMFIVRTYSNKQDDLIEVMQSHYNFSSHLVTRELKSIEISMKWMASEILKSQTKCDFSGDCDIFKKEFVSTQPITKMRNIYWYSNASKSLSKIVDLGVVKHKSNKFNKIINANKEKRNVYYDFKIQGKVFKNTVYSLKNIYSKGTYLGTLVISFDAAKIFKSVYLNSKSIVRQISLISYDGSVLGSSFYEIFEKDQGLKKILSHVNDFKDMPSKIVSLNFTKGSNYIIKPLPNHPFFLYISLDKDEINVKFFKSLLNRFIEIIVLGVFFISITILIYKREKHLLEKTKTANKIANDSRNAKTEFLVYTAHQIRSPLGFILTGSEVMIKEVFGKLPVRYKEYVKGINKNANQILNFITDILNEHSIKHERFKLDKEQNDVTLIINKAIKLTETNYPEVKNKIVKKITSNIPNLYCDSKRMIQVINQILNNSVEYSKDSVSIEVRCSLVNFNLFIEIEDKGIGISKEDIDVALNKLGTVKDLNDNYINSYGLGLPIVKIFIEAQGGRLNIKSEIDKGTIVQLIFGPELLVGQDIKNGSK